MSESGETRMVLALEVNGVAVIEISGPAVDGRLGLVDDRDGVIAFLRGHAAKYEYRTWRIVEVDATDREVIEAHSG